MIFLLTRENSIIALDTISNYRVKKYDMNEAPSCNPIIADRKIIIGTKNGNIYIYDMDKGKKIWSHTIEGEVVLLAAARGKIFAIGSTGNILYIFGELPDDNGEKEDPERVGYDSSYSIIVLMLLFLNRKAKR